MLSVPQINHAGESKTMSFDSIVFSLRNKDGNLILVQMYLYTIGN